MKRKGFVLDVVANNIPYRPNFQTGWGNACLIRGPGCAVLFDTGGDGDSLLQNLEEVGISPSGIKYVVVSHEHDDHTGGLWAFLQANRKALVFAPASFSQAFRSRVRAAGARLVSVKGPGRICEGVYSTGEMRGRKWEQSLALRTAQGLVILTGCAHPGIANIVERCVRVLKDKPHLALGGFHLKDVPGSEIDGVIARLRKTGLDRVAPNHCTGASASRRIRAAWGEGFIETGCGASLTIAGASPPITAIRIPVPDHAL